MAGLINKVYVAATSPKTFTVPAGVTSLILLGQGGGGGGSAGNGSYNALPGSATNLIMRIVTVVPNTTYTITIGAGGTGGASGAFSDSAGGDTSFGSLATFKGGSKYNGSNARSYNKEELTTGVYSYTSVFTSAILPTNSPFNTYKVGTGTTTSTSWPPGISSIETEAGVSSQAGGRGTYAGDGGLNGVATAGTNAAGIGGGGAGGGVGSVSNGAGGNGGSGRLIVCWVE
jgi:hypothetical protein